MQLQILMEVLDLDLAHFIQYRPEGPFAGQEFMLTEVPRSRDWFAAALPVMRSFIADWRALEGDPDAHQKILGTRRRATRKEAEAVTAEQLWAVVATRPAAFLDLPFNACADPYGEEAHAARVQELTEAVTKAACPFADDACITESGECGAGGDDPREVGEDDAVEEG